MAAHRRPAGCDSLERSPEALGSLAVSADLTTAWHRGRPGLSREASLWACSSPACLCTFNRCPALSGPVFLFVLVGAEHRGLVPLHR